MNADDILIAMNDISEELAFVPDAAERGHVSRKRMRRWIVPAAAVFLAALAGLSVLLFKGPMTVVMPKPLGVMLVGDCGGQQRSFEIFKKEELEMAQNDPVELIHKYDAEREKEIEENSLCVLRIGFFVYGGRLYRHVDLGDFGSTELMGEKLGKVRGVGWLGKDPATYDELTGLTGGTIYEVKGFDPEFMVCKKGAGSKIITYICDNGYVISKGEDVFEERYRFSERLESLVYENPGDHKYKKRYALDPDVPEVRSFIEAIDKASWRLMDVMDAIWLDQENLIENDYRVLTFKLGGIDVSAWLYNGYHLFVAGYGGCAVDLDEKDIKPLLDLMDSHENSVPVENNGDSAFLTVEDAKADPRFGKYVPSYIPEGFELDYCIARYGVDEFTGKRTGTISIAFDYRAADDRFLTVSVKSADAVREVDEGADEDKRSTAPLSKLTPDTVMSAWWDDDSDYRCVGSYAGDTGIYVSSDGLSAEELVKIIRSGLE